MNRRISNTDEMLVTRYANGENEAFDELLSRYQERLFRYIHYIVRDADQAEDIFQETFIKAILTIREGRYSESGKFSAWLCRIARNLIIDSYRQERQETRISCDRSELSLLNSLQLAENTIEQELVTKQTLDDVCRLMNALPDEQQQVLHMRFYQNLSFKEIATQTGVSINTSLGRMRYALLNMRRLAKQRGVELNVS